MKDGRREYGAELILKGGDSRGVVRAHVALDSPIAVSELSPEGLAVLRAFILQSATEDVQSRRLGALSVYERACMAQMVDEMLARPAMTPQAKI